MRLRQNLLRAHQVTRTFRQGNIEIEPVGSEVTGGELLAIQKSADVHDSNIQRILNSIRAPDRSPWDGYNVLLFDRQRTVYYLAQVEYIEEVRADEQRSRLKARDQEIAGTREWWMHGKGAGVLLLACAVVVWAAFQIGGGSSVRPDQPPAITDTEGLRLQLARDRAFDEAMDAAGIQSDCVLRAIQEGISRSQALRICPPARP